jgi:N-dimethylarginine dimethylaminohydrolase
MTPIRTPGGEPSTLGGPGWQPRSGSHAEEIGTIWGDFAVSSEIAPLTAVLLTWPGDELAFEGDPAARLMHARPDLARMREEALGLAEAYEAHGVAVHWLRAFLGGTAPQTPGSARFGSMQRARPRSTAVRHGASSGSGRTSRTGVVGPLPGKGEGGLPNLVFARDLLFMTPEGAVLARMAAQQRAGEERYAARAIAALGIPILATPTGHATFEGADALWLRQDLVVVGVGRRTNPAGFEVVRRVLEDQHVDSVAVPLSPNVQHLLGSVNLVRSDLAVVREPSSELVLLLDRLRIARMDLDDDPVTAREVVEGRANNFVTLGPGVVLMPAGNPASRARMEAEGVTVVERAVSQYLCAAGGIGCATGILRRDR